MDYTVFSMMSFLHHSAQEVYLTEHFNQNTDDCTVQDLIKFAFLLQTWRNLQRNYIFYEFVSKITGITYIWLCLFLY